MVIKCIESRRDKLHVRSVFSDIADALLILCSSYKATTDFTFGRHKSGRERVVEHVLYFILYM